MQGDAWGPHGEPCRQWGEGIPQVRGEVRSYYGTSEVQGEVGHSMEMEDEVVPMYRMGVYGSSWRAWGGL